MKVYKIFHKFVEIFKQDIPEDSIVITALLHDICKANTYTIDFRNAKIDDKCTNPKYIEQAKKNNGWYKKEVYKFKPTEPLGHSEKSVIILQKFIKLTDWEIYAILYHMGFTGVFQLDSGFNDATEKYNNIILLHTADIISSKMFENREE